MRRFRNRKNAGQGIVEYSFIIAFVACCILLAFNLSKNSLFAGISGSYSGVNSSLSQLNFTAQRNGGGAL